MLVAIIIISVFLKILRTDYLFIPFFILFQEGGGEREIEALMKRKNH